MSSSSEPGNLGNVPVADGAGAVATSEGTGDGWFVEVVGKDGETKRYRKHEIGTRLRQDLLDHVYENGAKATTHMLGQDGKWVETGFSLPNLVKAHFPLRMLYQPVWSHALGGLKWGILVGIGFKLVENLIVCAMINPVLALSYLIAIGVCIPKIGKFAIMAGLYLVFMQGMPWPPFMMILSGALVGALLGALPGMFVGGLVGVVRRGSLPKGGPLLTEPAGVVAKAILLPLVGACALLLFWFFVVNPWILNWLETVE